MIDFRSRTELMGYDYNSPETDVEQIANIVRKHLQIQSTEGCISFCGGRSWLPRINYSRTLYFADNNSNKIMEEREMINGNPFLPSPSGSIFIKCDALHYRSPFPINGSEHKTALARSLRRHYRSVSIRALRNYLIARNSSNFFRSRRQKRIKAKAVKYLEQFAY